MLATSDLISSTTAVGFAFVFFAAAELLVDYLFGKTLDYFCFFICTGGEGPLDDDFILIPTILVGLYIFFLSEVRLTAVDLFFSRFMLIAFMR